MQTVKTQYRGKYQEIENSIPKACPNKLRDRFGNYIILNPFGGGSKTTETAGKARGLKAINLAITDIFGTSAGVSVTTPNFIKETDVFNSLYYFYKEALNNPKNFYPENYRQEGKKVFPQGDMLSETIRQSKMKPEAFSNAEIRVNILTSFRKKTKSRNKKALYMLQALAINRASRMIMKKKKSKVINFFLEHFTTFDDFQLHTWLAKFMGFKHEFITNEAISKFDDIAEPFMRGCSQPPITKVYEDDEKFYIDGGVISNNMMPLIAKSKKCPSTVITLLTYPIDHYTKAALCINKYKKVEKLSDNIILCSYPKKVTYPHQQVIWGVDKQEMTTWGFNKPEETLELYAEGLESTKEFVKVFNLAA